MRIGKLRHRVTIQQPAGEGPPDAYGHREPVRTDVATVWADVMDLAGSEAASGPSIGADTTHRIEMRFRPGVTPKMRVVHGDEVFNVNAVLDPDRRRVRLFLFCTKKL